VKRAQQGRWPGALIDCNACPSADEAVVYCLARTVAEESFLEVSCATLTSNCG
jgi:hypothetical protein